jgi:hypothetical protein
MQIESPQDPTLRGVPSLKDIDDATSASREGGDSAFNDTPAASSSTAAASREGGTNKTVTVNAYCYDMTGHVEQCVQRYLELAQVSVDTLKPVATPCIDDHQIPPEDFEAKGNLSDKAARIVLKCLFTGRMLRCDALWAINMLARNVTKWTVACDKRLHRLIAYLHHTKGKVLECMVGDPPEKCKLALFSDANFAGDLRGSKSTSGAFLVLVGYVRANHLDLQEAVRNFPFLDRS